MLDPPTAPPDTGVPDTAERTDTLPAAAAEATNGAPPPPVVTATGSDAGSVVLPRSWPPANCTLAAYEREHADHALPNNVEHPENQLVLNVFRKHKLATKHRAEPAAVKRFEALILGCPSEDKLRKLLREFCAKLQEIKHPRKLLQELIDHGAGGLVDANLLIRKRDRKTAADPIEDATRIALNQQGMMGGWATNTETNCLIRSVLAFSEDATESWVESERVRKARVAINVIPGGAVMASGFGKKTSALKELDELVATFKPTAEFRTRFAASAAMHNLFVKGLKEKGRQVGIDRAIGKDAKNVVLADVTFDSVCTALVRNQQYFFAFTDENACRDMLAIPERKKRVRMLARFSNEDLLAAVEEKAFYAGEPAAAEESDTDFADGGGVAEDDDDGVEMEVDGDGDDDE